MGDCKFKMYKYDVKITINSTLVAATSASVDYH